MNFVEHLSLTLRVDSAFQLGLFWAQLVLRNGTILKNLIDAANFAELFIESDLDRVPSLAQLVNVNEQLHVLLHDQ